MSDETVIETTAETVSDEPSAAQQLVLTVGRACGRSPRGNLTCAPTITPELMAADAATIREAIRETMPPSWEKRLPALTERLETLDDNDLRLLLVLALSYFAQGRIQGKIDARKEYERAAEEA